MKFISTFELVAQAGATGEVEKIDFEKSSNKCLQASVEKSVAKWIFAKGDEGARSVKLRIKIFRHSDAPENERIMDSFRDY